MCWLWFSWFWLWSVFCSNPPMALAFAASDNNNNNNAGVVSSSSSPIPPPPPISMPVWSLACPTGAAAAAAAAAAAIVDGAAQDDDLNKKIQTSMNILTFATPVSIQPKLWALSLYHNTLTKDSFLQHSHGILQLLQPPQACLVPILGKKSGRDIDKAQECQTAGFPWVMTTMMGEQQQQQHSILPNCPLYLAIRLIRLVDAGDHVVAICQVTQTGTWKQDSSNVEWHLPEDTPLPPMDAPNVLYTGWLRDNGFL